MSSVDDISPGYRRFVVDYLSQEKDKRERNIREVELAFEEVIDMRLVGDPTMSADDVRSLLAQLLDVVRGSVEDELENAAHAHAELLRRIFCEADQCRVSLSLEGMLETFDSQEAVHGISDFETKLSTLPSISGSSADGTKLEHIQRELTGMMKEKTNLQHLCDERGDEIETLTSRIMTLVEEKHALDEEKGHITEEKDVKAMEKEDLEKEVERLRKTVQAKDEQLSELSGQITRRVNESTQFKNMMRMIQGKNEELRSLRKKLKEFVGDEEEQDNNE